MRRIFYNGFFTTFDAQISKAEAIYVEDGLIRAIGSKEEVELQWGRADVERIDLQGGYVYPGLVDNHLHLAMYGMKLSMLDFSNVTSKDEMLHLIEKQVKVTPIGQWVLGLNWDENRFADRAIPTIEELDRIAPHHPVFLTRVDYHTYFANRKAFELAGVHEGQLDPSNGAYGRDQHGRFTGLIHENAYIPFHEAQPKPTYHDLKEYVRKAMADALRCGITAVHTDDVRNIGTISDTLQIYHELVQEGYYLRSHHLIDHGSLDELQAVNLSYHAGDEWVRIGACKLFADGSMGGRTAYLSEPYSDDPANVGLPIHTQHNMEQIVLRARQLGVPVAVHAIGDAAAEMVIQSVERYPLEQYLPKPARDRLIHAQVMRPDLIERLKSLSIAIDIQPRFVASDFPWVIERIGHQRGAYAYAWKTLLNAGLICGGGSDAPIEPIDPRLGIHAAITRRAPSEQHEGYFPEQKLTPMEAIRLFTLGAAYTAGEEKERGSISIGKFADLSVFDRPLHENPEQILQANTLFTITNGVIAYSR